jgi:hypothetical protein
MPEAECLAYIAAFEAVYTKKMAILLIYGITIASAQSDTSVEKAPGR